MSGIGRRGRKIGKKLRGLFLGLSYFSEDARNKFVFRFFWFL